MTKPSTNTQTRIPIDGIAWPAVNNITANKMTILSEQLEESQWWTEEEISRQQEKQLGKICKLARETTPFYANTLKNLSIDEKTGVRLEDLRKMPVVIRSDIQDRFEDMLCRDRSVERGLPSKFVTSGSTSTPVTIHISQTVSDMVQVLQHRWYDWAGVDGNKSLGDLRSYVIDKKQNSILKKNRWHINFPDGENEKCNMSLSFTKKLNWLLDFRPAYLCTYPSVALELMRHAAKNNIDISFIETIFTYGEAKLKGLNELAQKVCGARIFEKYSSREMGCMALECPETGLLHIQTDNVLLEVIKEDGSTALEGETGKIVITSLLNSAMPLIRYEIGDYAIVGPKCSCGRGQPTLLTVLGRERNMFRLRNGDSIRSFTNIADMETFSKIRQFQYIQTDYDDVTFKYVSDNALDDQTIAAIGVAIVDMFPVKFNITYKRVDNMPRNKGGKFEDMICEIKD